MASIVVNRLAGLILVLVAVSIVTFLLPTFVPGDVALVVAGPGASQQAIERIRQELNLDKPVHVRYSLWLSAVGQGDLGRSVITNQPIGQMVGFRLVATLKLAVVSMAMAVLSGVALGVIAALRRNTAVDYLSTVASVMGISAPIFWVGLMLIYAFSVRLKWLPITEQGGPAFIVLPALTLAVYSAAMITRVTRASLLEVLGKGFVRTAASKGASRLRVVIAHGLRNALIPIVTVVGMQFGYLMGGAVLTETVFAYPGIGRLFADSVFRRDFPVMQVLMLVFALLFALVNFLVDMSYTLLDPRIRHS